MRVDFYQLSRDPVESVIPQLAQNTLKSGERLLVVSADDAQLAKVSGELWKRPDSFLANGRAGASDQDRQPILLSDQVEPANSARFVALADGQWRDAALTFERVFLLFDDATLESARGTWRMLDDREGVERHFWRQENGKWVKTA